MVACMSCMWTLSAMAWWPKSSVSPKEKPGLTPAPASHWQKPPGLWSRPVPLPWA